MENHAIIYRKALKPGLTRLELAELSSHCYALWSSEFQMQPVLLFRIDAEGQPIAYLTRKSDEDNASLEPRDALTLVATYENGKVVSRTPTAMTAWLDEVYPQYALVPV